MTDKKEGDIEKKLEEITNKTIEDSIKETKKHIDTEKEVKRDYVTKDVIRSSSFLKGSLTGKIILFSLIGILAIVSIKISSNYSPRNLTRICENIEQHYKLPKGTYFAKKDAIIDAGETLEIQPGTTIKFKSRAGLISYGTLIAIGTNDSKITFTASGKKWRNITFAGSSSSNSRLEYCIISQGEGRRNVPAAGSFRGFTNKFRGLKKMKAGGGILTVGSSPTIRNCTIDDNYAKAGGAVYAVRGSSPRVENCNITNNVTTWSGTTLQSDKSSHIYSNNNKFKGNKTYVAL